MEKICRSAAALHRLSRLNLRLTPTTHVYNYNIGITTSAQPWNKIIVRQYNSNHKPPSGLSGTKVYSGQHNSDEESNFPSQSITEILEREIRDESTELSQHLSTDQFPGFSVEANDADVKLTKQVGNATVTVRFTVSSSLNEWSEPQEHGADQTDMGNMNTKLVSMPEFQVQIFKNGQTLELSCYFEEMDIDEETGESQSSEPFFCIDELVLYDGAPKETEFAVSAEYFQEDLQASLMKYLADHGIDDIFAKNLIEFATSYEKKLYIGLMQRLKNFVSK